MIMRTMKEMETKTNEPRLMFLVGLRWPTTTETRTVRFLSRWARISLPYVSVIITATVSPVPAHRTTVLHCTAVYFNLYSLHCTAVYLYTVLQYNSTAVLTLILSACFYFTEFLRLFSVLCILIFYVYCFLFICVKLLQKDVLSRSWCWMTLTLSTRTVSLIDEVTVTSSINDTFPSIFRPWHRSSGSHSSHTHLLLLLSITT